MKKPILPIKKLLQKTVAPAKPAIFALAFVFVGIVTVLLTQASTPTASFEAESGIISGQASVSSNGTSSSGSHIVFGANPSGETFSFLETFDGAPINPEPFNPRDWDIMQTTRDRTHWENPDVVDAHHAFHNCGDVATGGSHQIQTWPETVFKCNGHVMTSINGTPGYGAVYLSPPALMDFSSQKSTLSFDVSTFVSSTRDWLDILITPFEDYKIYPFRSDLDVDSNGLPQRAIHIEQSFGSDKWDIEVSRNGQAEKLGSLTIPYGGFGGPSRVTRTPVRVEVTRTSLTLSYPTVPGSSFTANFTDLGWTQGYVQLGHHSYIPGKDCTPSAQYTCAANTWHWDNIGITPARRLNQWQATPERTGAPVYDENIRELDLGKSAPANAMLYFSGECNVDLRENNTATWRRATIVGIRNIPEHTQSYSISVPQGTTSMQFKFAANDWYTPGGYGCSLANPIVRAIQ